MFLHSIEGQAWRSVGASIAGPRHGRAKEPGQDANQAAEVTDAEGEPVLVVAVADGAGSARCAAAGAQLAASALLDCAQTMLQIAPLRRITDGWMRDVLQETRLRVLDAAGDEPFEYSTTLEFALLGRERQWLCQIGDGAVAFRTEEGRWQLLGAPQNLEFANATRFVIDEDAAIRAQTRLMTGVTHVALLTDGLDECALAARTEAPYAPFFDYMVRGTMPPVSGHQRPPQNWLVTQLAAAAIRNRSDDDKTIVVCGRK